jgi:hypothetical protein
VLCCAVLCCAVLCCAVLCCAVLCCAVLCCAVLCCVHHCYCVRACVQRSDSTDFYESCLAAGLTSADVELEVWPRMWHCFQQYAEGCGVAAEGGGDAAAAAAAAAQPKPLMEVRRNARSFSDAMLYYLGLN